MNDSWVPARQVVERLEDDEPIENFTTAELETANMYLGLLGTVVEDELGRRYSQPIDIAQTPETATTCPHGNTVWFGHECGLCE